MSSNALFEKSKYSLLSQILPPRSLLTFFSEDGFWSI